MNRKTVYRSRSGHYVDDTHWYSSDYRHNRRKDNNFRPPITSNAEKQIAIEIHNSRVESNKTILRPELRHDFHQNSRFDSRQSVKRFNNSVETTKSHKRLRIEDPFDSPNPMIKDFRLNDKINTNLVKSTNDLFCQKCHQMFSSSLDYSNHLNGEPHKSKTVLNDKNPKERDRLKPLKPFDDCNQFQRLFKRFKCKEPIIGLKYIKETETDVFSCGLCKCSGLRPFNFIEHIRGYRHQRNYSAQKSLEDKNKKSFDCEKRQPKEKSVCTSTQTTPITDNYSTGDDSHINQSSRRKRRTSNSSNSSLSPMETIPNHLTNECQSERFDSCVKTIENFKTIRQICDQMIGYFTEKQKSVRNVSSNSSSRATRESTIQKTSFDCLSSKIKKEN